MSQRGTIEPDILRTLVAIAETGSFTAAASLAGRTQSAVSMQIRRLERLLGHTLLVRRRFSQVQLTERGRSLLVRAREMLALHDAIWDEFHAPDPHAAFTPGTDALPLRAQRDAFTAQIMMTLLTDARFVEAYALVMRFVEQKQRVDPTALDPRSDDLLMGLLSMLEYVAINFLAGAIDREMLLRQRRSGLIRVWETLCDYIAYKRRAWDRPRAYRSFEAMIKDHVLAAGPAERAEGHEAA